MPDEPDPPETAALPAQAGMSATQKPPAANEASSVSIGGRLEPGQRWHEYQIGDPIQTEVGRCYHAINVGQLENVIIRVRPCDEHTEMRSQAWAELTSLDQPALVKGIDAIEEGGYRFEISYPPPQTTLHEWAACRQASLDDVQLLVQQISDVIITLHDRGVVHLNLRPDTIYILSEDGGLHVTVGGLEQATTYNQPELIPAPVDPLYAPPEAAGLSKHTPGAGLRAWDWWTLGRIMQELVLGRHILSIVANRDVSRATPELRARAEALLLERDPQAPRAGAVELMPQMSQRLTDLLRGLLTSSRGGRWGTDEILRWLKQQPVKDRYQLGRTEELFAWKDRTFTVAEAAEYFVREENWNDGLTNLFAKDDPATLIFFVTDHPEYSQERKQIDEVKKYLQLPNWCELPEPVKNDAVAAAIWLLLGGEDANLVFYGQRLDANCFRGLFARGSVADGVAMARALTALPYIQLIEKGDPEAGRLLSSMSALLTGEAFTNAIKQGWLEQTNPADQARLMLLALEPEQHLLELRSGLIKRFACTRDARLQPLFAQTKLTRSELVLLGTTAAQPERFSYVTHEDWNRERHGLLKQRGARLIAALYWLRLERAMRIGVALFGPWPVVLGIWIVVAVAAWWPSHHPHALLWIFTTLVLATALRAATTLALRASVRRLAPDAAPWPWLLKAPAARCRDEARKILEKDNLPDKLHALSAEYSALNVEVAALALVPRPGPLPPPDRALPVWAGSCGSWALCGLVFFFAYWRPAGNSTDALDPAAAAAQAIEKSLSAGAAAEKLTPEDYFYDNPKVPRTRWKEAKPAQAPAIPVAKVKPATADDVAAALVDGQRLLLPYQRGSVNAPIAVPVKGKDGDGLILYDARNRRIIQREVLLPAQLPADKSWFEVDKLKVFYAGTPPPPPPLPQKIVVDPQKPVDTSDLPEREVHRGAYQGVILPAEQKTTNAQPLSEALDRMNP